MRQAKHINEALDRTLAGIGRPSPVAIGDKRHHQEMARQCAEQIRHCYSGDKKQKARSACLAHLRASLCASAATEVSTEVRMTGEV